ncbi:MAG: hypothetical protein AB7I48_20870 [Planctomycetaceae bacterium]
MKTVRVTGRVLVDGKTIELPKQVLILAHPLEGESPTSAELGANVNPDGSFVFSTYEAGDGLPVGDYKLTFQLGQINLLRGRLEGDDFKGKYSDPETSEHPLNVSETDSGPIDMGTIELSVK